MRIFANKNIWKKLIIVLLIIITFNFVAPKPVGASLGGTLMKPICKLVVGIGDGIMNGIHRIILGQDLVIYPIIETGFWARLVSVLIIAVIAVVCAVLIATGIGAIVGATTIGLGAAIAAVGSVVKVVVVGVVAGAAVAYGSKAFSEEVDLPLFSITPETIIADRIPLFNANFINPPQDPVIPARVGTGGETVSGAVVKRSEDGSHIEIPEELKDKWDDIQREAIEKGGWDRIYSYRPKDPNDINSKEYSICYPPYTTGDEGKIAALYKTEKMGNMADSGDLNGYDVYLQEIEVDNKKYYVIKEEDPVDSEQFGYEISEVTSGATPSSTGSSSGESGDVQESSDSDATEVLEGKYALSYDLQHTVSKWYGILRTIAAVGMMSVLVYIGIRILISSAASQKAKYKELLQDWAIGMVLLFSLHYIMSFANVFTEELTEMLSSVNPTEQYVILPNKSDKIEIKKTLLDSKDGIGVESPKGSGTYVEEGSGRVIWEVVDENNILWHTNLMGTIRIATHAYSQDDSSDASYIGFSIMYLVLVCYTLFFGFTYIKRAVYLAFLTMIAPLVALTYPIDKVTDGKAQGFNTWFREYMFNLLLQPMHLLLYALLVSSAVDLASTNWLYSLVAIGFIASGEKIIRTLFNFQKASTPGMFAGPAGAALMFTGLRNLLNKGPKGGAEKEGADEAGGGGEKPSLKAAAKAFKGIPGKGGTDAGDKAGAAGAAAAAGGGTKGSNASDEKLDAKKEALRRAKEQQRVIGNQRNQAQAQYDKLKEELSGDNLKALSEDERRKKVDQLAAQREKLKDLDDKYNLAGDKKDLLNEQIEEYENGGKQESTNENAEAMSGGLGSSGETGNLADYSLGLDSGGNDDEENLTRRQRLGRGFSNAWQLSKSNGAQRYKNAKPFRKLGKSFAQFGAGAALGTMGLAAGIASGDLNKVGQFTALGALGGGKLGGAYADSLGNELSARLKPLKNEFKRGYLGEDAYKDTLNEKKIKELINNASVINDLQKEGITAKEAKGWLKENGKVLVKNKVSEGDMSDVYKAMKNISFTDGSGEKVKLTIEQAIGAMQFDKEFSGIQNPDERIAAIQQSLKVSPAGAQTFEQIRGAYNSVRRGSGGETTIMVDSIKPMTAASSTEARRREEEMKKDMRKLGEQVDDAQKAFKKSARDIKEATSSIKGSKRKKGK